MSACAHETGSNVDKIKLIPAINIRNLLILLPYVAIIITTLVNTMPIKIINRMVDIVEKPAL